METPFFDGPVEERELSTGARIGLPVRYYEWSALMAHFPAPAAALRRLLPTPRLRPAELFPGTGILTMAAMEYRRIADVEPYNEFGIMVPVLYEPRLRVPGLPLFAPHRFKRFGLYVHHLPVTTQAAYDFGVEIWGYPKFVADISFEDRGDIRRCRLSADGKDIVTLDVRKAATKARSLSFYTYTVKDGRILRALVQTEGQYFISRFPGGASFTPGDHPLGEEIKALRMARTAVGRVHAPQVQSMLHEASERLPL